MFVEKNLTVLFVSLLKALQVKPRRVETNDNFKLILGTNAKYTNNSHIVVAAVAEVTPLFLVRHADILRFS